MLPVFVTDVMAETGLPFHGEMDVMTSVRTRSLALSGVAGFLVLGIVYALRIGPATTNTTYSSWPAVFSGVVGGPTILVVIAVATALGGLPLVVMLNERWTAHIRTRGRITRWILAEVLTKALLVAAIMGTCVLLWGVLLYGWIAPATPELIDPDNYGHPAEVAEMVDGSFPLYAVAGHSWLLFVALSTVWAGAHAGLISVIASLSALLIPHRVIALLAPAALLLLISIGSELMGSPAASPFVAWMHPGGLLPSDLTQSLIPGVVLGTAAAVLLTAVLRRSPTLVRFA